MTGDDDLFDLRLMEIKRYYSPTVFEFSFDIIFTSKSNEHLQCMFQDGGHGIGGDGDR